MATHRLSSDVGVKQGCTSRQARDRRKKLGEATASTGRRNRVVTCIKDCVKTLSRVLEPGLDMMGKSAGVKPKFLPLSKTYKPVDRFSGYSFYDRKFIILARLAGCPKMLGV